jgi:hypothetical protein
VSETVSHLLSLSLSLPLSLSLSLARVASKRTGGKAHGRRAGLNLVVAKHRPVCAKEKTNIRERERENERENEREREDR